MKPTNGLHVPLASRAAIPAAPLARQAADSTWMTLPVCRIFGGPMLNLENQKNGRAICAISPCSSRLIEQVYVVPSWQNADGSNKPGFLGMFPDDDGATKSHLKRLIQLITIKSTEAQVDSLVPDQNDFQKLADDLHVWATRCDAGYGGELGPKCRLFSIC
jgi:hypothetical protein